jgi:hypothetical protein
MGCGLFDVRYPPIATKFCSAAHCRDVPKSDISLSGHPKDQSYNSKPRGFYLQPGGTQNLAW